MKKVPQAIIPPPTQNTNTPYRGPYLSPGAVPSMERGERIKDRHNVDTTGMNRDKWKRPKGATLHFWKSTGGTQEGEGNRCRSGRGKNKRLSGAKYRKKRVGERYSGSHGSNPDEVPLPCHQQGWSEKLPRKVNAGLGARTGLPYDMIVQYART